MTNIQASTQRTGTGYRGRISFYSDSGQYLWSELCPVVRLTIQDALFDAEWMADECAGPIYEIN